LERIEICNLYRKFSGCFLVIDRNRGKLIENGITQNKKAPVKDEGNLVEKKLTTE